MASSVPRDQGYEQEAQYYDYYRGDFLEDIKLYQALLLGTHKVLVPMCGTGRIVFGMAEAGWEAEGVDSSGAMLARAQQKRLGLSPEKAKNISFVQEDILHYREPPSFDAAILGGNSYPLLLRRSERITALQNIRSALLPGGRLVLQTESAEGHMAFAHGLPTLVAYRPLPENGGQYLRMVSAAPAGSSFVHHSTYHGIIHPTKGPISQSYSHTYYRVLALAELLAEVAEAGFKVTRVLGDYKGNPYRPGGPTIILFADATGSASSPTAKQDSYDDILRR